MASLGAGQQPAWAELAEPDVLRGLLGALELKLDGTRAAADTIRLRRTTLGNALEYAVETKALGENPLSEVRVKKHRAKLHQVDRRSVVNPVQARQRSEIGAEWTDSRTRSEQRSLKHREDSRADAVLA
ncbi:hypothetical protein [Saccharopolyspora terrae]|uniref:hypothetical protein n=1 Tax=Saccharopolyspora terrae TaxID=2530384 RepID=UPI001F4678C9|nr:hypothetical protein [Saccharopolyspora terrae]